MTKRLTIFLASAIRCSGVLCAVVCVGTAAWGGTFGETGTGTTFLSIEGNARAARLAAGASPSGTATADSITAYIRTVNTHVDEIPIDITMRAALYRTDSVTATSFWGTRVDTVPAFIYSAPFGTTTQWFSKSLFSGRTIYSDTNYVPFFHCQTIASITVTVGYNPSSTNDTLFTEVMTTAWANPIEGQITANAKPSVYCTYTLTAKTPARRRKIILENQGVIEYIKKTFAGCDDEIPK